MINTHMFEIARRFSGISDSCHHSHFSATCVTDRDVYLEDSGEHLGPGIVFQGIFLGTAFFVGDAFFVIWFQDDHFAVLGVWREDATPFDGRSHESAASCWVRGLGTAGHRVYWLFRTDAHRAHDPAQ